MTKAYSKAIMQKTRFRNKLKIPLTETKYSITNKKTTVRPL